MGLLRKREDAEKKCYGNVQSFFVCTRYCSVDEIKEVGVDAVFSLHGRDQICMQKMVASHEGKICLGRLTMLDID